MLGLLKTKIFAGRLRECCYAQNISYEKGLYKWIAVGLLFLLSIQTYARRQQWGKEPGTESEQWGLVLSLLLLPYGLGPQFSNTKPYHISLPIMLNIYPPQFRKNRVLFVFEIRTVGMELVLNTYLLNNQRIKEEYE